MTDVMSHLWVSVCAAAFVEQRIAHKRAMSDWPDRTDDDRYMAQAAEMADAACAAHDRLRLPRVREGGL